MQVILSMFILTNYTLRDFKSISIVTVVTATVLPVIDILIVFILNICLVLYSLPNDDFDLCLCKNNGEVPVLNELSTTPRRRIGEWNYSSTFLDLDSKQRCTVSFTPRPLYPCGNSPESLLGRRLDNPQSQSGRCAVEKNPLSQPSNP
jgi:hypothetical protein